ncbi:MAG: hypothetical protein HUU20_07655 [Pirellulales bacterium]|nr:hypothetical protein [Pirellulales bacterium]
MPIEVVAEPSGWYANHRVPTIDEVSKGRTRVLVWFGAMSMSGESFGGTCLYLQSEALPGRWPGLTWGRRFGTGKDQSQA